MSFIKPCQSL